MKKLVLAALAICSFSTIKAQKNNVQLQQKPIAQKLSNNNAPEAVSGRFIPYAFDTCGLIYPYQTDTGYVTGNNEFLDKEKTMRYRLSSAGLTTPATVDTVLAIFKSKFGPGTGQVRAKVYSATGNSLGALLGTSNPVNVSSIDTGGFTFERFTFPNPVSIPGDEFIVAIDFNSLYATGDYLGLLSTASPCPFVDTNQAGEIWSDNSFHLIGAWDNWNIDLAMAIFPHITAELADVRNISSETWALQVFPQPADDVMNVRFSATKQDMTLRLYDVAGKVLYSEHIKAGTGSLVQRSIATSQFSPGVYLLELNNGTQKTMMKVAIQ